LTFGNLVGHSLHVDATDIACPNCANQRLDVTGDATLVDCNGCRPLRSLEPRNDQPGARRIEVFVANFGDRQRPLHLTLVALRVASFRSGTDNCLGPLSGLIDRVRTVAPDRDAALKAADANLCDKHLPARRIYPDAKTRQSATPDEVTFGLRLGIIDRPLG